MKEGSASSAPSAPNMSGGGEGERASWAARPQPTASLDELLSSVKRCVIDGEVPEEDAEEEDDDDDDDDDDSGEDTRLRKINVPKTATCTLSDIILYCVV